jgi:hypothetical protein
MHKKTLSLFLLAATAVIPAFAQEKRGPSTEAERTKAVAAIDDLEKNPFGPDAKEQRRWLIFWLAEVPDIHVSVCLLLPDLPKNGKKDSDILFGQMMFAGAKYAIQHKDDPANNLAQFQAGLAGAMRMYEVLVSQNPKDRQPKLDELLERLHAGTLDAYVADTAPKACSASLKAQ